MSPPVSPVASASTIPPRADAVAIGGGMAGIAAAYELARRRASVAVIEKGVVAGEQSSRISASRAYCEEIDAGN